MLLRGERSHGPFLRLGDLGLRGRREAQALGGDFDQLGAPVVFGRPGRRQPPLSRFFTTTATVVRSSATTPPIVALSIGPWVASADRVTYWSGVRSNA